MSKKFKKLRKKVVAPVKKVAKKVGRKAQAVTAKIVKPVTGLLSAAGTVLFGPAVGAGIAFAGAGIARKTGATAARDKGVKGRAARTKGRKLAKKTLKIGLLATGVGGLVSAGVSAATGGNVLEGAGLGQIGSKLLGSKSAAPAATEEPEVNILDTLKTEADLYKGLENPGQDAADAGILGTGLDFIKRLAGRSSSDISNPGGAPPPGDGTIFGIPKPYALGGAAVVVVLWFMSRRRAA